MVEGSNASALLGLRGMVMTGIEVAITAGTAADRVGCRSCGVIASLHDRRRVRVRVRDLEIAGRPTALIWNNEAVSRDFGVGWACVMNAVEVHGRRLDNDPDRISEVRRLGLDGTAFQRPSKNRGLTSCVIGFVDLTRPRLLDVVADWTGAAVDSWMSSQPAGWLANISEVVLDPQRGQFNGLNNTLPHATVVVDRFHAIGLAKPPCR